MSRARRLREARQQALYAQDRARRLEATGEWILAQQNSRPLGGSSTARGDASTRAAVGEEAAHPMSARVGSLHKREADASPRLGAGENAGPGGPAGFGGNGALAQQEARERARTTDPASSRRAAWEVTSTGRAGRQQQEVLEALTRYEGSTSRELAALSGLDRYVCGRRLPELERKNLVRRLEGFEGSDVRWYVRGRPVEEVRSPLLSD